MPGIQFDTGLSLFYIPPQQSDIFIADWGYCEKKEEIYEGG